MTCIVAFISRRATGVVLLIQRPTKPDKFRRFIAGPLPPADSLRSFRYAERTSPGQRRSYLFLTQPFPATFPSREPHGNTAMGSAKGVHVSGSVSRRQLPGSGEQIGSFQSAPGRSFVTAGCARSIARPT
ncbi:hypothetical protein NP493_915g00059 [Ridgeia piscesae]|uniref:Uncharacterized protein n=1 Tax=Ridgeia piscesae TaxID=27915 RepID=A0AAD9KKQ8_RIDPI|nr:hypothetical protein NP493_915g00059 [Ridgeia piscesae]